MQYYTETDCFWLDQICRWLSITIFVIFSLTFFGVCLAKTKLPVDANFTKYEYTANTANFAEVNFGYFFGFYTFITVMYVGVFYLFPHLVKN